MNITNLVLEGYKSFRDRNDVTLRDLTILSGANSSGKSSVMQPLLLMKQTLEAGYDPGPLLISGPNIIFSNIDQMLWNAPGEKTDKFRIGLFIIKKDQSYGYEVLLQQTRSGTTPLQILEGVWHQGKDMHRVAPEMDFNLDNKKFSPEQFNAFFNFIETIDPKRANKSVSKEDLIPKTTIKQINFFLRLVTSIEVKAKDNQTTATFNFGGSNDLFDPTSFLGAIRRVIHVPGLRGNPLRTYPVTAVEHNFPGLFPNYVASIVSLWQTNKDPKLSQLGADLKELGLTWTVKTKKTSDTEVEIRVGRLPQSRRGGGKDMVNIADVGFGMSQALPVVVALLAAEPGMLVYLEQPEMHLHPRAEYGMAKLIQRAVERGVQVVVETHSELLLTGIQELVAKKLFSDKRVILHWVQRQKKTGASFIESVELDQKGGFGKVPVDFGSVSFDAMKAYLDATIEE